MDWAASRSGSNACRPDRRSPSDWHDSPVEDEPVSGPSAIFRLSGGHGPWITVSLGLGADEPLAADIVFRYMQRLGQALAERLERFQDAGPGEVRHEPRPAADPDRRDRPASERARATVGALAERGLGWVGLILGRHRSPGARGAGRGPRDSARRHGRRPTLWPASIPPRGDEPTKSSRRRPWTQSRPIEAIPPPRAPLRVAAGAAGRQPGRGQDDLELSQGPQAPRLDGAGRRRAPIDRRLHLHPADAAGLPRQGRDRDQPPDYDPALATLVSHDIGRRDAGSQERYIPNRAAQLKSRRLQERVVNDTVIAADLSQYRGPRRRAVPLPERPAAPEERQHLHRHPRGKRPRPDQEAAGDPAPRVPEGGEGREREEDRGDEGLRRSRT